MPSQQGLTCSTQKALFYSAVAYSWPARPGVGNHIFTVNLKPFVDKWSHDSWRGFMCNCRAVGNYFRWWRLESCSSKDIGDIMNGQQLSC